MDKNNEEQVVTQVEPKVEEAVADEVSGVPKDNEGTTPASEGDEKEPEVVKDESGNEFVPKKAFEARIARLTAQKNEGAKATEVLQMLRDNPDVRQQFIEELRGNQKRQEDPASKRSSAVSEYVSTLAEADRPAVRSFVKAIGSEIQDYVDGSLKSLKQELVESMSPLRRAIGEGAVEKFFSKIPEAAAYKEQIRDLLNDNPKLTLEQAFKVSAYDDRAKQSRVSVTKSLHPITKDGGGKATKVQYKNVQEAAAAAYDSLKEKGLFRD